MIGWLIYAAAALWLCEDGGPPSAPLPSSNLVPFGMVARERWVTLSRKAGRGAAARIGQAGLRMLSRESSVPDWARAKGSSIVDEPGEL